VENLCDIILNSGISSTILYKTYTLEPNTQYIISTNTYMLDLFVANVFADSGESLTPSTDNNGVKGTRIVTSDSNGKITIGYRNYNNLLDYASGNYYIQLEKGNKAHSYSPYGQAPIEFCKIGSYQDFPFKAINGDEYYDSLTATEKENLTYGGWYKHKEIGKVVLDGSESGWDANSSYTLFNLSNIFNGTYLVQNAFSNYFVNVVNENITGGGSANQLLSDNQFSFRWGTTKDRIYIKTSLFNSTAEFKAWLSTHNLEVYYVLATPIEEEITNETVIAQLEAIYNGAKSYKGTTHIYTETDGISPILDVIYYDEITLKTKLQAIANETTTKLIPTNIKKDVTIFGVTGTYEGEPSLYNTITNPVISEHGYGEISSVLKNITELPDLDLTTNNVTSMESAFMNFKGLTTLPNFSTSNLVNLSDMCENCVSLTSIPALNLPNCTTLYSIFSGCTSLSNVGNITTGTQLGDVRRMFYGCTALTSAPTISNTSNVAQAHSMFEGCSSLEDVPVYNFYNTTSGGLQNIFKNCTSLTNESLNNILAMCINTWRQTSSYKTLQYIGLTETQANTCQTLSNWSDFESAGWSTGY
jgi:hypothetical protein